MAPTSTVLLVGSGPKSRSMPMYEKLQCPGVNIIVVDDEDGWSADLESKGLIHKRVIIPGLFSCPQNMDLAQRIVSAVQEASLSIDAVYNAYNKYLLITSLVVESLQVRGNSFESVQRCVFKHKTRECLVDSKLESWLTFSIMTKDDMKKASAAMEYPAVLKPAKGSGSTGVVRVDTAAEAIKEFDQLQLLSWVRPDTVFILEEYIDGPEFGVELVMLDGKVIFSSIMDAAKQSSGNYFQGTGRSCPSTEDAGTQADVIKHCVQAAQTIGLTSGVVDIDVRFSSVLGPRVIEINPRMGGGSVSIMHEIYFNIDLVEVQLKIALGHSVEDLFTSTPSQVHYEAGWVMSPHSGEVQNISLFMDGLKSEFQNCENLVRIEPLQEDGSSVAGYKENVLPTSLIQVVTKGCSQTEAVQTLGTILLAAAACITQLVPELEPAKVVTDTLEVPTMLSSEVLEAVESILEVAAQVAILDGSLNRTISGVLAEGEPMNELHAQLMSEEQPWSSRQPSLSSREPSFSQQPSFHKPQVLGGTTRDGYQ